jgi:uncharacterized protein
MALADKINQDLDAGMRAGESELVNTLRLLKTSIKNEQIKQGHELDDAEAIKVLQREAKQRRDSVAAYRQGGRNDLADAEEAELAIITKYLPEQMTEADLMAVVDAVVKEAGASDLSQMGMVIGKVMAQIKGQADGATVSRLVKERLGQAS